MAISEIVFDQVNGPKLVILNQDGVTTSSLILDSSNTIKTAEGTPISVASASYIAPAALTSSLPAGLYSSSAQLPSGLVSSSTQLPAGLVSGSLQTVANISGQQISPTGVTSSFFGTSSWSQTSRTASYADFSSVANKPTLVSSSAQVLVGSSVFSSSAQLPSGLYSSSAQLPVGTVSSSAQVVASLPAGLYSSSAQVVASLPAGTVSGSSQVLIGSGTYSSSAQLPSGLFSSSAQLPSGTVSSSAQVLVGSGTYSSSAQLPSGLISGSSQLPAGTVSSSAQILVGSGTYSSSAQLPSGIASSSAQVVSLISGQQISPTGITSSLFGTATTASYVAWANIDENTSSQFLGTASYATTAKTASYIGSDDINTFEVAKSGSYAGGVLFAEHWMTPIASGACNWVPSSSGTGAGFSSITAEALHPGIVGMSTGTTAAGIAILSMNDTIRLAAGDNWAFEAQVRLPVTSSAAQTYTLRIGLGDPMIPGDFPDGVYFELDTTSSVNWKCKAASNGTRTTTVSAQPGVSNTWYTLRCEIAGTTTASFFVNNTSIGTVTTNIPNGVGREIGPAIKIQKTVGTTAVLAHIDSYKLIYK